MIAVMEAFKHGDLRVLKDVIHDDIVWKSTAPAPLFRFGGERSKREHINDLLALIFATYLFRRFDPKEIVAENDIVWGLFEVEAVYLPARATVRTDFAMRWRVRDGKIVEHQGFFDTASVLLQQGDFPVPAAAKLGA